MKISEVPGIQTLEDSRALCGVYFLFIHRELVYVGQSTNIRNRIATHRQDNRIDFDSVFFIEVDEDKLIQVEKGYIIRYDPKYNQTHIFERELRKIRRILHRDAGYGGHEPEILVNDFTKQDIPSNIVEKKPRRESATPKTTMIKSDIDIRFYISKKDFHDLTGAVPAHVNRHLLARTVFMEFIKKYRKAKNNKENKCQINNRIRIRAQTYRQ